MKKQPKPAKTKQIKIDPKQLEYYLSLPYTILLSPMSDADGGGFHVGIPELEGCYSYGKTPNKAVKQIKRAQALWLEGSIAAGDEIPLPINEYTETTEAG